MSLVNLFNFILFLSLVYNIIIIKVWNILIVLSNHPKNLLVLLTNH